MKPGTGITLISQSKTITSSYYVTNPNVGYTIKTTVTNDPKEVTSLLSRIKRSTREKVIGLEVQYCRYSNKPAILTLRGFDIYISTLIIQLPNFLNNIPDQLRDLFSDKRCKFVGANVGRSVAMLKKHYGIGINVYRYEDIFDIAGGRSLEEFLSPSYTNIVSKIMMELMLMRKTPAIEGAVWEKEELDDDLVAYASLDSYLSYFIGSPIVRIK